MILDFDLRCHIFNLILVSDIYHLRLPHLASDYVPCDWGREARVKMLKNLNTRIL